MIDLKITGSVNSTERLNIIELVINNSDISPQYKEALIHHIRTSLQQKYFEGVKYAKARYAVDELTRAKLEAVITGFEKGGDYNETSNIIGAELESIAQAHKTGV